MQKSFKEELLLKRFSNFKTSARRCAYFVSPTIHSLGFCFDYIIFGNSHIEVYFLRVLLLIGAFPIESYVRKSNKLNNIQIAILSIFFLHSCWMSYLSILRGGFGSSYAQGINIISLIAGIFFPWTPLFLIFIPIISYGPLLASCFALTSYDPEQAFGSLFMMLASLITFAVARMMFDSLQKKELSLQLRLTREIDNRQKIIDAQVKSLSETKVANAVVETAQMIAHDVRKPFLQFRLMQKVFESTKNMDDFKNLLTKYSSSVEKSLTYVDKILRDIMSFRSSTHQTPTFSSAKIEDIFRDAIEQISFTGTEAEKRVTFEIKSTTDISIQRGRFERVLINLISNALEATSPSELIKLSAEDVTSMVKISISNPGSIKPELKSKIFEPFVTHGKSTGTGLGLSIAQRILEEHGTKLELEESDGVVNFFFYLRTDQLNA